MQKCGKVILWFLSGHNSSKSLLPGMPQLFLFVLGQLLRGVKEATTIIAQACGPPSLLVRSCFSQLSLRSCPGGLGSGGLATQLPLETETSPTSVCQAATRFLK